ncbi:DNA-methyltransferase [Brevundimonas diminuta]|uniref:DNA-methyltransferase n=1 Tax=Brevundimonas diminuta TaxID=293 RepID=UPI001F58A862|nr:site-specific DNA-methyltransferase [Brevundimonas diminuta]
MFGVTEKKMEQSKSKRGMPHVVDPAPVEGSSATLVTADCLTWLKDQPDASIPIFFFSPPFNKRRANATPTGKIWPSKLADGYATYHDAKSHDDYVSWMHELLTECWRVLRHDGAIFFQHKDQPHLARLLTPDELIPAEVYAHLRQRIIWHRQAAHCPNRNFLNPSFEFIHLLAKPGFKFATAGKICDVLPIRPTAKIDSDHPAPMPVELPQRIFEQLGAEHGVVCDIFSGSGTTGVAARATGHDYIGIEINEGYNSRAAKRLGCADPRAATLWLGDALERMREIPDGSVNLIATDLPYGQTKCAWDRELPSEQLWSEFRRILKPNGTVVMTTAGLFSAKQMIAGGDLYKQSLVWEKNRPTCFIHASHRPLSAHEDVLVFSKGGVGIRATHRMTYNPQNLQELAAPKVSRNGGKGAAVYRTAPLKYTFDRKQTHTNYPRSILKFASVAKPLHHTQKPVELFDWIVRTYSNPGDVVFDPCMGSGTTGVAALSSGRRFIGIEREAKFFEIAEKRIGGTAGIAAPQASVAVEAESIWTPAEQAVWDERRAALRAARAKAKPKPECQIVTLSNALNRRSDIQPDDLPMVA